MATQPKADEYVFDRSYIDNARLNLQHKFWVDTYGYLLHPSIPTSQEGISIADVGTGTGIWLTDLSRKLPPSTKLDGFDISLEQAEPLAWFPPNVKLRQWDIMTDVPTDLVGKYDIVHIRLFVFVVPFDKGPKEILEKLVKLLKPGGYLQWGEIDVTTSKLRKTDPSNSSSALEELRRMGQNKGPLLQPTWVKGLPDLFKDVGLEDLKHDVMQANERDSYGMLECSMLAFGMLFGTGEEVAKLTSEAVKEARGGTMFEVERITVVGRKAVSAEA